MATTTEDHLGANGTRGGALTIDPFRCLTDAALTGVRQIYEALPPTRDTLGVLFAVDAAQTEPTEAWIGFFVETACSQLVWDERPTGTLLASDAAWVLARFDDAPTIAGLAILVRLCEEAQRIPGDFKADVRRRAALFSALIDRAEPPRQRVKSVPYLRLVA